MKAIREDLYSHLDEVQSRKSETLTRRRFVQLMGGGIAIVLSAKDLFASGISTPESADESTIAAWIHITDKGKVIVYTGKVEVGQNIRTSLSQVVAEELRVPMEAIEMIMGDTQLTPYDRGTFGSRTTPTMSPQLRMAAASLREELVTIAATRFKAKPSALEAVDGMIRYQGKALTYSELTQGKKIAKSVNAQVALTPSSRWKIAGQSIPKINLRDFVTGKHRYASDIVVPNMLYGKILRAPAYGSSLDNVDTSSTSHRTGVQVVHDGDFVGAVAADSATAEAAIWDIKATWMHKPQPSRSNIYDFFKQHAQEPRSVEMKGDVDAEFAKSKHVLSQQFSIDYIAHVPLEPRAAVAQWDGDKLTVWTGTQVPFGVQEDLAGFFKTSKDAVRVIMPDTGSGYGGKHSGEAALEAARLARAVGKPVKVTWTREEEFKWAYFRPAGLMDVKSACNDAGLITAWEFHNYNSGTAGIETPYEVPNQRIQFHRVDSPLRQGSYRALASTGNIFALESHLYDMAIMLRMDPLEFRLKNLKEGRLRNTLEATAKSFGWGTRKQGEAGHGIACGTEKGGFIATAAAVSIVNNEVKLERLAIAFECGKIINPRHLKSQVVGGVLQGLGGALFEAIDFDDGKVINAALSHYRVPRFKDIPDLTVDLLDRPDLPSSGAGEAPLVAVAPAIRQAIAEATGKKINHMPMLGGGIKA